MNIGGVGVAMVTPFKKNGAIDFDAISRIVEHIIAGGANYLVVMGTTAESVTLNQAERQAVIDTIVAVNKKRLPLIIGVGGNNTRAVADELAEGDFQHFEAILSVSPYYNRPDQRGIYAHYECIANESPLPIILYNVPARTGSNMDAETTLRLAECKNIIGIKEASNNLLQVQEIIKYAPADFQIIAGDDALALPMVLSGAIGAISVLGNVLTAPFMKMIKSAINKDVEEAYTTYYSLFDIFSLLFEEGNPTGIKALMEMFSLCEKTVRLPLVEASPDLVNKMSASVKMIV